MNRKIPCLDLRMLRWTPVILCFMALTMCAGSAVRAQYIDLKPEVTFSLTNDIVALAEHELGVTIPVDVSFSVGSVAVDLDCSADVVSSKVRLDTLPALHSEVASLPAGALKDALIQSLSQANAAIDAIRSAGSAISIEDLYDDLKVIEKALDAQFVDIVDDSVELLPLSRARLLLIAKPIELRYDYLKYITNKVKSYALDEVKDGFACLLRQTVVSIADGDSIAYRRDLLAIIAHAEEYRGTMIKQEEADWIRYKADLLLRKIAENGTSRACDVDISTMIADIDIDGGLSWDEADYRAPSKDVRTDGSDLTATYTGEEWDVSVDYQYEWLDYTDRLKDDDDRLKHSLDISVSRDVDPYNADLSLSLDHEFYPRDIDEEIEVDRVTEARADISNLLNRALALHLAATLEARLVKDLGEDGALGALAIGDRSEAVDCLDDFIGHLLDAEWDGDIEPDTSQALIAMARGILPRRTIDNIDVPLSLGFPFRDGDATLDLEWESKTYPADSPLDHDTSTGKLNYTKDESAFTLSGYLEREELVYPNATTKNRSLWEWEGSFDKEMACGDLALTLFHQQTTYPFASKKDQLVHKLDLDLDIDIDDLSIAFQWTDKVTVHPNDAAKPIVQVTEMGLDTDWDVAQGTLSASLSDDQEWNTDASIGEKILVKETRQAEISWDGEITDDLDLTFSLTWKSVTDFADPIVQVTEMGLDADWDVAQGTLSASLSGEQEWNTDASLAEKILVKETRQADLSWDGEITDDLDLTLSMTWKNVTAWADPSKNSGDIVFEVQLDLSI